MKFLEMEVRLVVLLCVFALFAVINARNVKSKPGAIEDTYGDLVKDEEEGVQNDDYDEYDDETGEPQEENGETGNEVIAEFRSQPQEFGARIGDTVELPCEVTNPDVILVWKRNEAELLYQGDISVNDMSNIKKTTKGLAVSLTSPKDFGQYTCQMMLTPENSPTIVHTIVAEGPPKIISVLAEGNRTVYSVGDTLKLSCLAGGFPKPKISWHKNNERLGKEGENLTIPDLKLKHAGFYRCLADNGMKPAAHGYIMINIEHKPVVSIDKYIVNSDREKDAELKCTVHAYPPPVVIWKKDGVNIVADPPKIELRRHQDNIENILMITNLTDADFGSYTCSAVNKFENVEKTVSLVRTPAVREFIKPDKSSKDVILTWKVESKAPIVQHELQYRRKGEKEWRKVNPEVTFDGNDMYTLKFTLKGLEPGSYETRARSQNAHGWSEYSDVMAFEGVLAKSGPHHKHNKKHHQNKEKQPPSSSTQGTPAQQQENESSVGASQTSGSSSLLSSISLTSITLLMILCYRK